jgi:16S rRNA (uracil1498-N3)-methyltransferase
MHRFYCPQANFFSQQAVISDKDEIHHLQHVLRLKKGVPVKIFNGKGKEALGTITSLGPKEVGIRIQKVHEIKHRKPLLILACAVPRKNKFELIIEKATELGVDEIIPVNTQRTVISLPEVRLKRKLLRYETVAINAAKQSQRSIVPLIHPVTDFPSVIKELKKSDLGIIPSLSGKRKHLLETFSENKNPDKIFFLIGPEGDFTEDEYGLARQKGYIPVTLGETVLKVETAAICVLACVNQYYRRTA